MIAKPPRRAASHRPEIQRFTRRIALLSGLCAAALAVLLVFAADAQDAPRPAVPDARPETSSSPAAPALPPALEPVVAVPGGAREAPSFFRVGYLRGNAAGAWPEALREALLGDEDFAAAMRQTGMTDVALRPCDGGEEMLQRMGLGEFELVYCPALVYAQEQAVYEGRYRALYQRRRREADSPASHGPVLRRAAVFVRRGSPLDRPPEDLLPVEILNYLDGANLAVAGAYDAAYFYARLTLWEKFENCRPEFVFFGDPKQVVQAVATGLVPAGACDEAALREVFDEMPTQQGEDLEIRDGANPVVRTILRTQPFPTDPVAVREELDPASRAPLGEALARVLWTFHNEPAPRLRDAVPLLERTTGRRAYGPMTGDVQRTRERQW